MKRKYVWFGITALVLAFGFALFNLKPAFKSQVINPPLPAAEIRLTDDRGREFRLSKTRGKLVLLYFGFVNCPEECPLTMAHLKQALESLGPVARDVQVVMVSTDPVRDSPQTLQTFLNRFSPDFIGLPGTPEQLGQVWQDYGVEVLDGGETHSSYTYVIDRSGRQRLVFTPESTPEDISADLRILLAE